MTATTIPLVVADFTTSLAAAVSAAATTATIQSVTDNDGVALANGTYVFTIDGSNSSKEYIIATITGTSLASIQSISRQGAVTSGFARSHRVGATVVVTDHAALTQIISVLRGTGTLNSASPLAYDAHPTFSSNFQLIDKKYADDLAIAGAPDASDTVKGIVELATQAEIDARTTAGATGALLVGTPDTNRTVLTHDYAASSTGNDSYAITLTPAVTAYTTGDVYRFKADVANTGACTLNVNAVGAKSLKMNSNLDPVDGYIKAGALVECMYDGTNLQIMSVSGKPSVSQTGEEIYAADAGANDTYAITLTPAPTAYVTGMTLRFKANTGNTGTATLNVNGLGAKTIVKGVSTTLDTGDIAASQISTVIYDGTNFVLQSPTAITFRGLRASGSVTRDMSLSSSTQTIAHGLGVAPVIYMLHGFSSSGSAANSFNTSYNSNSSGGTSGTPTGNFELGFTAGNYITGTITVDATNISIAWNKYGAPSGTAYIIWQAIA